MAVDVVEQLYRQQEARGGDGAAGEQVALAGGSAGLERRLAERGVAWRSLSGFLQRALLWDLGLVLTDTRELVQVLVPCGQPMDVAFLSLEDMQGIARDDACAVEACANRSKAHQFAAANCSVERVYSIAQCVYRNDSSVAVSSAAAPVWSLEQESASMELEMRVYRRPDSAASYQANATNGSAAATNQSNSTSDLFIIHQVPLTPGDSEYNCGDAPAFTIPCVPSNWVNLEDWCEPAGNSFINLWIEKERATTQTNDAGISRGTAALLFMLLALALIICVVGGAYICYTRRRKEAKLSGQHSASARQAQLVTPVDAKISRFSGVSELHDSLAELQLVDSYWISSKGQQSSKVNSNSSSSSAFFVDNASSSVESSGNIDVVNSSMLHDSLELRSFCSDSELMKRRVPYHSITFNSLIARGANGEVWSGVFRGQVVAIKTMLPDKRHDKSAIGMFAHEIRLSSSLAHPNIVRFVGLAWHRLSDLCILSEFMSKGDLSELISSKLSGRMTWNREKLSIAIDIAEALVYLHSRSPAIIHRDLKSLNVLLDDSLRAKLSDFGLSRERSFEETMTTGVGTLLWTAPEILRGEPYSEKADIYSYGIVFSELDTCLPPFSLNDESSRQHLTTMQIMHLVTRAQISPQLRGDCPPELERLARACTAPDAGQRPSALQIVFTLRAISAASRFE